MSDTESQVQEPVPAELELPTEDNEISEQFTANKKRLYVNNVSYYATEDDFQEMLKDFKVLSILIPSQTVRGFKVIQQKSFGIAYLDFKTEEDAEKAKVEINGKFLHNRPLRVKNFVPYQPKVQVKASKPTRKHSIFHRKAKKEDKDDKEEVFVIETVETVDTEVKEPEAVEGTTEVVGEEGSEPLDENQEDNELEEPVIAVSEDTVFIGHLSPRINDGELRAFFHEFQPTDVYIFKSRGPRNKSFFPKHRHVSALVTLTNFENLSIVFEKLADTRLRGKHVELKAAHLGKIEAVKKAAILRQKLLDQQKLDAKGAASAALTASSEPEVNSVPTDSESPAVENEDVEDKVVDESEEAEELPEQEE